jgi:hypothetical protein
VIVGYEPAAILVSREAMKRKSFNLQARLESRGVSLKPPAEACISMRRGRHLVVGKEFDFKGWVLVALAVVV